jgi:hypothetical protein
MKKLLLIATLMISVTGFSQNVMKQCLDSIVSPELYKEIFD